MLFQLRAIEKKSYPQKKRLEKKNTKMLTISNFNPNS